MTLKVMFLAFLIVISQCLHLQSNDTISTLPQPATNVSFLNSMYEDLVERGYDYQNKSKLITQNKQLADFLEKGLNIQFDELYQIEQMLIPTVELNPETCSNLTNEQIEALTKKIQCAQDKLKNLDQILSNVNNRTTNATIRPDLARRSNLILLYLEQIKFSLNQRCVNPQVISTTSYFYNPDATDWVYGSKVKNEDIVQFYKTLSQKGSVTICPIETPFISTKENKCIACPSPYTIFDMSLQTCVGCPGNSTLNTTTHQCQCPCTTYINAEGNCIPKIIVYSNGNYLNLAGANQASVTEYGKIINTAQSSAHAIRGECAQNQNSRITSCVKCTDNQVFLVDGLKCVSCPDFNKETHICPSAAKCLDQAQPQPQPGTPSSYVVTTVTTRPV